MKVNGLMRVVHRQTIREFSKVGRSRDIHPAKAGYVIRVYLRIDKASIHFQKKMPGETRVNIDSPKKTDPMYTP